MSESSKVNNNEETFDKYIVISGEEYRILLDSARFLRLLGEGGVSNWDGYEGAVKLYNGDDE